MSGRLASFRGPSTPTKAPAKFQAAQSPSSPARQVESTYHRKTRTILQDLRGHTETWDDLVLHDGLKNLKLLVDTRTELEYGLVASYPCTQRSERHIAIPSLPSQIDVQETISLALNFG